MADRDSAPIGVISARSGSGTGSPVARSLKQHGPASTRRLQRADRLRMRIIVVIQILKGIVGLIWPGICQS
jgi:hypothetical protein